MKSLPFSPPNSQLNVATLRQSSFASNTTLKHALIFHQRRSLTVHCTSGDNNNNSSTSTSNDISTEKPGTIPPDTVEIRFRRGSRKKQKQRQEDGFENRAVSKTAAVPKKWEEMTTMEKAMELYVGEKGLLFWLNKFAYASIFIIIGAWILFRFVGPSLNLYQLDTPPLSPTKIFK